MNTNQINSENATLDAICSEIVPLFITPIPSRETVRDWLDNANIPRFKSNPTAKRGGGPVYYSVAAVKEFFKNGAAKKQTANQGDWLERLKQRRADIFKP